MYWQQPHQQHPPPQGGWNMPGSNSVGATLQDRVRLYTQYYHDWTKVANSPSSDSSQRQWATYYADLASRAAHYFHQNQNVAEPHPDLKLPPPPPPSAPPTGNPSQQQQGNAQVTDPKSFKAYLDRCLQQCKSPKEKQAIAEKSKEVLKRAIQAGNLQSKDWSLEPLLLHDGNRARSPDPSRSPSASSSVGDSNSFGYYGPVGQSSPLSSKKKKHSKKAKQLDKKKRPLIDMSSATSSDGYYGPSASSSSLSATGSSFSYKRSKGDNGFNTSSDALNKRKQRFSSSFLRQTASFDAEESSTKGPIVIGTCQVLEKEYLRLTSAPKPELVRPQEVLEKHFANLKSEYANVKFRREYLWFCSQLKAIRQDATIQHLKNSFCVSVYEFHTKVAMDADDTNELNQCLTQLKYLYPALKETGEPLPNRPEFLSYRILYAVYMHNHSEKATIDLKDIVGDDEMSLFLMDNGDKSDSDGRKVVKHALSVLSAAQEGNYHLFFKHYPSSFGNQNFFLDKLAPIIRLRAVERICGAYRPSVDVDFVCKALKLPRGKEGVEWLESVGCVMEKVTDSSDDGESRDRLLIKTKDSVIKMPENPKEASKLM